MKLIVIVICLLAGCHTPSNAELVMILGGKGPIACIEDVPDGDNINTCRDATGTIWVCDRAHDSTRCAKLTAFQAVWISPMQFLAENPAP